MQKTKRSPCPNTAHLTLKHRLLAYLSGDFTLPRSYTLLTILLYLSLLFILIWFWK